MAGCGTMHSLASETLEETKFWSCARPGKKLAWSKQAVNNIYLSGLLQSLLSECQKLITAASVYYSEMPQGGNFVYFQCPAVGGELRSINRFLFALKPRHFAWSVVNLLD